MGKYKWILLLSEFRILSDQYYNNPEDLAEKIVCIEKKMADLAFPGESKDEAFNRHNNKERLRWLIRYFERKLLMISAIIEEFKGILENS